MLALSVTALAFGASGCTGQVDACPEPVDQAPVELCAFSVAREVMLDQHFLEREVSLVRSGLQAWEGASGGRIHYSLSIPAQHQELVDHVPVVGRLAIARIDRAHDAELIAEIDRQADPGGSKEGFVVGYAWPGKVLLLVDRIPSEAAFLAVVLHELGHDLGLGHAEDRGAIMFPRVSSLDRCLRESPRPTILDLQALSELVCPEGGGPLLAPQLWSGPRIELP